MSDPDVLSPPLSRPESSTAGPARVGVFVDSIGTYGRGIIRGILAYQRYRQWHLSMLRTWIFQPADFIETWSGDGLIAMIPDDTTAGSLRRLGKPVVAVSSLLPQRHPVSVLTDDEAVGRMAARHFLDRGFRNFAFYGHSAGSAEHAFDSRRKAGFESELAAAGHSAVSLGADEDAATAALQNLGLPAAVFTVNDEFGVRAIRLAEKASLRVPEQVAVLGVDNDELLTEVGDVPLSSIELPTFKIGFEAAALLDQLMSGHAPANTLIELAPVAVVTRKSTNITAIADPDVTAALAFIRQHAAEPINVSDVVSAVPVSRRVLERRFQRFLQRSLFDEIQRVHIERACSLLISTELSVEEVAKASGFVSRSRFHAAFGAVVGQTPKRYRQLYHDSKRAFEKISR